MSREAPTQLKGFAEQHPSLQDRAQVGREARSQVPRSSHRGWTEPPGRPDPVGALEEQNKDRVPWLVPIRHARMRTSAFAFYRGTASIMAGDLATTPNTGLTVQLGGDAHLSNFGAYASPERQLVFDANDFDETLAGPWEWDLKRLATSFMIAAQYRGFDRATCRASAAAAVEAYRTSMAQFATLGFLELWYQHTTVEHVVAQDGAGKAGLDKRVRRFARRAQGKTNLQALQKLTEQVGGRYRIHNAAPLVVPLRDLPAEYDPAALETVVHRGFEAYKATLSDERRALLDRYTPLDIALKVVGVGSVGTRSFILLLEGRDRNDPLFLQVKEAGPSALEPHLGASPYDNHGRRVVEGQRLIQAQSDIFLGWTEGREGRQFYVRQLRDWKGSVETENATPAMLAFYARLCGRTLARGHARTGDPVSIAAYMGGGRSLDRAVTDFSEAYAQQNQRDYDAFVAAIDDGRLEVADAATAGI